MPEISVEEPFSVSLISGMEKLYAYEVNFKFSIETFLSYSTEKLCRGTVPGFTKILVSKSFMDKSGRREYHNFPSKSFCLTVQGNPSVFPQFPLSKTFMPMRGFSRFSIKKIVVSQYRKTS